MKKTYTWLCLAPLLLGVVACGGDAEPAGDVEELALPDTTEEVAADQPTAQAKINLNTATREEFLTIPNVGDRMVGEFEEYRPYVSIQQFRREIAKYVSEEQVAAYEEYVYVPITPNESDAETLQQIPGLDENEAAELIAGRPYASHEAFLEKLGGYVSSEELATAESYLANP